MPILSFLHSNLAQPRVHARNVLVFRVYLYFKVLNAFFLFNQYVCKIIASFLWKAFAVNWLRSDGDVVTLHRILGHANIQTTMIYLRIVPLDQGRELMKIRFD
jgi:site-specific recombinase XerD